MALGSLLLLANWLWLLPLHQAEYPVFDKGSSLEGFWAHQQLVLQTGPFHHSSGDYIGTFGGKEWVPRLIKAFQSGHPYACAGGHWEDAFSLLTNHDLDKPEAWTAWWQEHSAQSQEEWIKDGFAVVAVTISVPPTKDDWPKLLRLKGAKSETEKLTSGKPLPKFPGHLLYNAFRCLRDSGFNPVAFSLENPELIKETDIREGLLAYERDQAFYTAPMPGRLAFAGEDRSLWFDEGRKTSFFYRKPGQAALIAASIAMIVCGLIFIRRTGSITPLG